MQFGCERLTLGGLVRTFQFLTPKEQCFLLGAESSLRKSEILQSFKPHARLMRSLDPFKIFLRCGEGDPLHLVDLIKATGATPEVKVPKIGRILTKYAPAVNALLCHTFEFSGGSGDQDDMRPRTIFGKITSVSDFTHQGKEWTDTQEKYDITSTTATGEIEAIFSGQFSSEGSCDTAGFTLRFRYSEYFCEQDFDGIERTRNFTPDLQLLAIDPPTFLSASEANSFCCGKDFPAPVTRTFIDLLDALRTEYVIPHLSKWEVARRSQFVTTSQFATSFLKRNQRCYERSQSEVGVWLDSYGLTLALGARGSSRLGHVGRMHWLL